MTVSETFKPEGSRDAYKQGIIRGVEGTTQGTREAYGEARMGSFFTFSSASGRLEWLFSSPFLRFWETGRLSFQQDSTVPGRLEDLFPYKTNSETGERGPLSVQNQQ